MAETLEERERVLDRVQSRLLGSNQGSYVVSISFLSNLNSSISEDWIKTCTNSGKSWVNRFRVLKTCSYNFMSIRSELDEGDKGVMFINHFFYQTQLIP